MNDDDIRALEDPEEWDLEGAERRTPTGSGRAVVSVAFLSEDFAAVAEAARQHGLRMSQFIREAAIEKAAGDPHPRRWGRTPARSE